MTKYDGTSNYLMPLFRGVLDDVWDGMLLYLDTAEVLQPSLLDNGRPASLSFALRSVLNRYWSVFGDTEKPQGLIHNRYTLPSDQCGYPFAGPQVLLPPVIPWDDPVEVMAWASPFYRAPLCLSWEGLAAELHAHHLRLMQNLSESDLDSVIDSVLDSGDDIPAYVDAPIADPVRSAGGPALDMFYNLVCVASVRWLTNQDIFDVCRSGTIDTESGWDAGVPDRGYGFGYIFINNAIDICNSVRTDTLPDNRR